MRALVISDTLTAKSSPASEIELGLLDCLAKSGINITAFCSLLREQNRSSGLFKTVGVNENERVVNIMKQLKRIIPDCFNIPDLHRWTWGKKVESKALIELMNNKYDYIHSFSHSSTCHLVAYHLHQKTGLPWIATFFDSWTDYPMLKYRTKLFKSINAKLERKVAENATIIIHNNEKLAQIWKERYGSRVASKIVVIPLNENFKGTVQQPISVGNKEVLQISHVGTFYPFRSAKAFVEGIRFFVETYPQMRSRIKVIFAGRTLSTDVELIKEYQLTDVFNLIGVLSRTECEDVYSNSDVLLATAEQPFEDYTFPSKIIKYFYYQKPILGICRPSSVLYSELTSSGHQCVSPGHLKDFADYMYKAITDYKSVCQFDKNYWKKFAVENVANMYVEEIKKISKN